MGDAGAGEVGRALAALAGPDVLVRAAELHGDVTALAPEERLLASGVAESRRRELATGRGLARALLAELGIRDHVLLPDTDRVPRWPEGVLGSLAHTRSLCALVLARTERVRALGLDLEDDAPLEPSLWNDLLTARERAWLARQRASERGRYAKLLFSAKECVHKLQFPEARLPLEFDEVEIELDLPSERFTARSSRALGALAAASQPLRGRFACAGGAFVTLLALPAASPRS